MELEEIKKRVKEKLSEKRYEHSLCVMEECARLALLYGEDIETAKKVGIAHDIAKEMTRQESKEYIKEHTTQIDKLEKEMEIFHAAIGADIAVSQFGYTKEMGQAIYAHTLGKYQMDRLTQILFVADSSSKDRNWNGVETLRKISNESLEKAVLYNLTMNLKRAIEMGWLIHPEAIQERNRLLIQQEKSERSN